MKAYAKSVAKRRRLDIFQVDIPNSVVEDVQTQIKTRQKVVSVHVLQKYGVDNPSKATVIKNKILDVQTEKYGGLGFASKEIAEKCHKTCLDKYGVEYSSQSEEARSKMKETNLERYGAENVFASEYGKQKIRETNLRKYGVDNPSKSDEIINRRFQTNIGRYGFKSPMKNDEVRKKNKQVINSPEAREKAYNTMKRNGSLNVSSPERDVGLKLKELFPDIVSQYRSDVYPYPCDFYVPSLDLYIECHFHWTHGGKFFDKSDQNDLEMLELLKEKTRRSKFYDVAIKTWTVRDILKLNTAIKNNLNYVVWFDKGQADNWIAHYRGG